MRSGARVWVELGLAAASPDALWCRKNGASVVMARSSGWERLGRRRARY